MLEDDNNNDERHTFKILGRNIGTFTGWDQADTFSMSVYGFIPNEGVDLPQVDCLTFSLEDGTAFWFTLPEGTEIDQEGNPVDPNVDWIENSVDFASKIIHLPINNN